MRECVLMRARMCVCVFVFLCVFLCVCVCEEREREREREREEGNAKSTHPLPRQKFGNTRKTTLMMSELSFIEGSSCAKISITCKTGRWHTVIVSGERFTCPLGADKCKIHFTTARRGIQTKIVASQVRVSSNTIK